MSPFRAQCFLVSLSWLLGVSSAQNITDDSFFYRQSPPVYPSPLGNGTGNWADSYSKAAKFVAQLSIEEKANLTYGIRRNANGCSGNIPPIERLEFPGLCLSDAGNGVRGTDFVNAYASGLHVGASWNKNLTNQRGIHMGGEFRAKGVNVALGPVVGPLGRMVQSGRNWEGFSNDPYLCGALAFETVSGIQSTGVITSTKHFIGNEQETNRNPEGNVASISSNIDDKTIHELYLWPFQDAVHAGTGNIMCSYNRLNNSYACSNSKSINGLLKTELGFQGFVVSDWDAQHAGYTTSEAGLDMAMPNSEFWGNGKLIEAVNNGSLPASRLDDQATRIIAAWYQMGQDSNYPSVGIGMPRMIDAPHAVVDARNPASKQVLLDLAIEGHVLVKNTNNVLPLKSPKLLSVFGYDAQVPIQNDVGNLWDLGQESAGNLITQDDADTFALSRQAARNGTVISGGGSGANSPAYVSGPLNALNGQAYTDGSTLLWDTVNVDSQAEINPASDACLVFINAFATEGADRIGLHDDFSDALVNNIANGCQNTLVVIHNAGIRLVDQWIDHPNVTGVIFAHLPGQDSGRAISSLLYGKSNPSGKLPYTVAKNESDYGAVLIPSQPVAPYELFPQSDFSEGIFIDYRAFDARNITPRFEFGFGLSYTTFAYSNLAISKTADSKTNLGPFPTGAIQPGGQGDLWDIIASVTATVGNTGAMAGAEVAQVYIGIPNGPVRQLRGFSKVLVDPGQSMDVVFELTRRDLSIWDVEAQLWRLQSGTYRVFVGGSSRDLPLSGQLVI